MCLAGLRNVQETTVAAVERMSWTVAGDEAREASGSDTEQCHTWHRKGKKRPRNRLLARGGAAGGSEEGREVTDLYANSITLAAD